MEKKVWTAKDVEKVLMIAQDVLSLDMKVSGDDDDGGETEIGAFIEDPAPGPEELLLQEDRKNTIHRCMREVLKPREREIICARFGLIDDTPHTLEEIGAEMNLTRERVRQLEKHALRKLKIALYRAQITEDARL